MESVQISSALRYIRHKTGFEFETRTVQRWCEAGRIQINGVVYPLATFKVAGRWHVMRASLEQIIQALAEQVAP